MTIYGLDVFQRNVKKDFREYSDGILEDFGDGIRKGRHNDHDRFSDQYQLPSTFNHRLSSQVPAI